MVQLRVDRPVSSGGGKENVTAQELYIMVSFVEKKWCGDLVIMVLARTSGTPFNNVLRTPRPPWHANIRGSLHPKLY